MNNGLIIYGPHGSGKSLFANKMAQAIGVEKSLFVTSSFFKEIKDWTTRIEKFKLLVVDECTETELFAFPAILERIPKQCSSCGTPSKEMKGPFTILLSTYKPDILHSTSLGYDVIESTYNSFVTT
jgi:hypothetical protein